MTQLAFLIIASRNIGNAAHNMMIILNIKINERGITLMRGAVEVRLRALLYVRNRTLMRCLSIYEDI